MPETSTVEKIEQDFGTWFRYELRGLTPAQIEEAKRFYLERRVEWEASYGGIARWGAIIMIPTMIGVLPFAKWMERAEEDARKKTKSLIASMRAQNHLFRIWNPDGFLWSHDDDKAAAAVNSAIEAFVITVGKSSLFF